MLLMSFCVLCDRPGEVVCARCAPHLRAAPSMPAPRHVDSCSALFDYADARPIVTALKNGGRRDLVGWLATRFAETLDVPTGAVVTWAPTGQARRRARGYDQAELLARAIARRWGLRCIAMLERRPGPAQAGLSAGQRRGNPSFVARRTCPEEVALVDDVVTTGATLASAASALHAAGAVQVRGIVVARSAGRVAQ